MAKKKVKFNKFEIYLGLYNNTQYRYDDVNKDNYNKIVKIKDYEKLGLIDSKSFNIEEILVDTKWDSLKHLIQSINTSKELFDEIEKLVRYYLEDVLYSNENGDFELVDFSISYLIDGEICEVSNYNEKRRKILVNILIYSSVFFLISGTILFFYNIIIGSIVFCLPLIFYYLYEFHKGLKKLRIELKYDREGKNIFLYYLIELPYKIVLYSFYIVLIFGWFLIPGYFIFESSFYYSLLELLGGEIGKVFWYTLYLFIMSYIGGKLMNYLDRIEKKIKSFF